MKKRSVYLGWWVVLGSFISNAMYSVTGLVAVGLFIEPMSSSLNWSIASISIGIAIRQAIGTILGPIIGPRVDASGPKALFIISTLFTGFATITLGFITNVWLFYIFYGLIGAIAITGISNLVTGTIISKWFIATRGRALGFADLGSSVGVVVLIPVINIIITSYSWQTAWVFLGILHLIIMAPVSFMMKREPEDYGLLPDNRFTDEEGPSNNRLESHTKSWTQKRLLKHINFGFLFFHLD